MLEIGAVRCRNEDECGARVLCSMFVIAFVGMGGWYSAVDPASDLPYMVLGIAGVVLAMILVFMLCCTLKISCGRGCCEFTCENFRVRCRGTDVAQAREVELAAVEEEKV